MQIVCLVVHLAFWTDMWAVVTSKQETGEAVAESDHGDEAKNGRFIWTE